MPRRGGWAWPQDPLRASAGPDNEEEQGGARAFLPEDLRPVVGAPGPGHGGGEVRGGPAARRVGGWREAGAPGGLSGERLAHNGVRRRWPGSVVYRVRQARGEGVSPAPCTNILTSPTSKSLSGRFRRWSAATSSEIPPSSGATSERAAAPRCCFGGRWPQGVPHG